MQKIMHEKKKRKTKHHSCKWKTFGEKKKEVIIHVEIKISNAKTKIHHIRKNFSNLLTMKSFPFNVEMN